MQPPQLAFQLMPFLILSVLAIPMAVGVGYLAKRLNKNVVLWVVLTLIPVVNFIFAYVVMFKVIYAVLDRLNDLTERMRHLDSVGSPRGS
jgi:hypothetical protein